MKLFNQFLTGHIRNSVSQESNKRLQSVGAATEVLSEPEPMPRFNVPQAEPGFELRPELVAAAQEGIPLFPVTVGSIYSVLAREHIGNASTDLRIVEGHALDNPGCQFGMAMGDKVIAIRMEGDFGLHQVKSLSHFALLTSEDYGAWETRLIHGGTTTWALYQCPAIAVGARGRALAAGLDLIGAGNWVPAPGSKFSGVRYDYFNQDVEIRKAPPYMEQLAIVSCAPDDQFWSRLGLPAWSTR